jgi:hypothetical protein
VRQFRGFRRLQPKPESTTANQAGDWPPFYLRKQTGAVYETLSSIRNTRRWASYRNPAELRHAVESYGMMEDYLQSFLSLALDRSQW